MRISYFTVLLLIVLNTLPNNVKEFSIQGNEMKQASLTMILDEKNDRWIVDDASNTEGNWLKMTSEYLIFSDRNNLDSILILDVMPEYKSIKWKKFKEYSIDQRKVELEKKKKEHRMNLIFSDEMEENSLKMSVSWN